jgi:hypothetical protein
LGIAQLRLVARQHLPELDMKVSVERPYSLVSLDEPTGAMRSVIDAAKRAATGDAP